MFIRLLEFLSIGGMQPDTFNISNDWEIQLNRNSIDNFDNVSNEGVVITTNFLFIIL